MCLLMRRLPKMSHITQRSHVTLGGNIIPVLEGYSVILTVLIDLVQLRKIKKEIIH
jgi:hypothetical protein